MRALIVGASGGIGGALRQGLIARGAQEVVGLSRSRDGLDVTDEASVEHALSGLEGTFDLVVCATGALGRPEKTLRAFSPEEMLSQMRVNALGPMLVLKHALRLLPPGRPSRFAALSARVGSIGDNALGGWYSYRASKAALNQLLHGAAIEVARLRPQAVVVALHPGTVATRFTTDYPREKFTPAVAAEQLLDVLDRLGPADSGGFFDWRGERVPW